MASNLIYLYDVEWQIMRVGMLGTWNNLSTAQQNWLDLAEYISKADSEMERKRRIWRVINYANAIRMGYSGQGIYGAGVDQLLVNERAVFQKYMMTIGHISLGEWDWRIVQRDLVDLHRKDRATFLKILENLQKRKDFSMKKIGTLKYRTELQQFVKMMLEVDTNAEGN